MQPTANIDIGGAAAAVLGSDPDPEPGDASPAAPSAAHAESRAFFNRWLNKPMRVVLSDRRVVVGIFLCTDQQANVILGHSREYLNAESEAAGEEPRSLGLAMVPGRHIGSIHVDAPLGT